MFCEETGAVRGPCGCATFASGAESGPCGCAVLMIDVVVDVVVLLIFVELDELDVLEEFPVVLTTSGPKPEAAFAGVIAKIEIAKRAIGKSTANFLSMTRRGLLAPGNEILSFSSGITKLIASTYE